MEPVFTLPFSEFSVAQQLAHHLPSSRGFSLYAPVSRQQKGVDLVMVRRRRGRASTATIQVKSSRTYTSRTETDRTKRPFQYRTWFNNFECPDEADFVFLTALYPPAEAWQDRRKGSWWAPVTLVFTRTEMKRFLRHVKTRSGNRDAMFGFGFDDEKAIYQTRGDRHRRYTDYTDHLLVSRLAEIVAFLA